MSISDQWGGPCQKLQLQLLNFLPFSETLSSSNVPSLQTSSFYFLGGREEEVNPLALLSPSSPNPYLIIKPHELKILLAVVFKSKLSKMQI